MLFLPEPNNRLEVNTGFWCDRPGLEFTSPRIQRSLWIQYLIMPHQWSALLNHDPVSNHHIRPDNNNPSPEQHPLTGSHALLMGFAELVLICNYQYFLFFLAIFTLFTQSKPNCPSDFSLCCQLMLHFFRPTAWRSSAAYRAALRGKLFSSSTFPSGFKRERSSLRSLDIFMLQRLIDILLLSLVLIDLSAIKFPSPSRLPDSSVPCLCPSPRLSSVALSFMPWSWTGAKSLIGSGVTELPVLIELKPLSP